MKLNELRKLSKTRVDEKWYNASVEMGGAKMNVVSVKAAIFEPMDTNNHICFAGPSQPEITQFIVGMKNHFEALVEAYDCLIELIDLIDDSDEKYQTQYYDSLMTREARSVIAKIEEIE